MADGYTVAVDWNGDGDYGDVHEDVTADVLRRGPVEFEYGRDQARQLSPPRVGSMSFTLCNADRIYSPENPDSPIAADIAPASPVKAEVTIGGNTYPLMRGRIDDFTVRPDRSDRSAAVTVLDGLALLRGTKIYTGVYRAQRTGTLINVILDEVGWTAPRDVDVGATFVPWWWAEDADAFDALVELLASEGPPAIAFVDPDGTFVFRDRHHRLLDAASLTPQAVFAAAEVACDAPAVTGFSYVEPFEYEHGWRDIINSVTLAVAERRAADRRSVIWESNDTITLTIGQSVQINATVGDPFIEALDIEPGVDITTTGPGVAVTSISRLSGQSLVITITAAGGSVAVTRLQVRARLIPVARTVQVAAQDSASVGRHGLRTYPDDVPWVGRHDAAAIIQLLLAHYGERKPTVQLRIVSSDTAHWLQVATRRISDLITIRNGEMGLDSNFYVEYLQHSIPRMTGEDCLGPVHYATLGCESGLPFETNPFTFDKVGAGFDDGVFDPIAADNPTKIFIFDHAVQGRFDTGAFAT